MRITFDVDEKITNLIENKIDERLPEIVEDILKDNIDEIIKDVVIKQLRSCALIYIQGQECRAKMMDKVRPKVDEMVGIE